ncbi:MAG TPA: Gfo/Idh/MocA family oxidoreductase [Ramlibacter sp.]|nr:Gfo/Idh/MocA family oxidoreductase [Ramlibacter sp.]
MTPARSERPRLGFLGLGWIGRHRMQALLDERACEVVAFADPSAEVRARMQAVPQAVAAPDLEALLQHDLDGVVIATPSALHAGQALAALDHGVAVFCQKPLARTAAENAVIVDAARKADRLLGCDLSYRHTEGMRRIRNAVLEGELGQVYAADFVFHNAWGPDKGWAHDPELSGGGCAIDLGIHLVDLALWTLGFPAVDRVGSRLYAGGQLLAPGSRTVEDHAVAQLELATGTVVRIACSWNSATGRDAVIEAHFHGTRGGAALQNVNGSFHDFTAARFDGTRRTPLAEPPDAWGGRGILEWARHLGGGARYNPAIETIVQVATVLDRVYGR